MSANIKVDDFTMRSHYIVQLAWVSMASRKENHLSPESILHAILLLHTSVAIKVMTDLGVDRDFLHERIKREGLIARRNRQETQGNDGQAPPGNVNPYEIVEQAREQSRLLQQKAVGSEHFLLAVLASQGVARQALNEAGITYELVKAKIVDICGGNAG